VLLLRCERPFPRFTSRAECRKYSFVGVPGRLPVPAVVAFPARVSVAHAVLWTDPELCQLLQVKGTFLLFFLSRWKRIFFLLFLPVDPLEVLLVVAVRSSESLCFCSDAKGPFRVSHPVQSVGSTPSSASLVDFSSQQLSHFLLAYPSPMLCCGLIMNFVRFSRSKELSTSFS
jgi:hypothetical protein